MIPPYFMKIITIILFLCMPIIVFAIEEPDWIRSTPQVPGKIYGIGVASLSQSESKSIEAAIESARFEVIARLKSRVEGAVSSQAQMLVQRSSSTKTSASSYNKIESQFKTTVIAEAISGLVIEKRYIDKSSQTVYVLAYLDTISAETGVAELIASIRNEYIALTDNFNKISSFVKIQELRKLSDRSKVAADLALLLSAVGSDKYLNSNAQKMHIEINNSLKDFQRNITIGFRPGLNLPDDIKVIFQEATAKEGMIWTNDRPSINIDVNFKGAQHGVDINRKYWWQREYRSDFTVLKAALVCSFGEPDGTVYGSFDLDAKGVGGDEFSANRALIKELRKEMPKRIHDVISKQLDWKL